MGIGGYNQINEALHADAIDEYLEAQLRHLPTISNVEQLSPRVIRVLGQNPGKVGGHDPLLRSGEMVSLKASS